MDAKTRGEYGSIATMLLRLQTCEPAGSKMAGVQTKERQKLYIIMRARPSVESDNNHITASYFQS